MSLEDLGNIGELVAAIGVIISLIYLAVQILQNVAQVRIRAEVKWWRTMGAIVSTSWNAP